MCKCKCKRKKRVFSIYLLFTFNFFMTGTQNCNFLFFVVYLYINHYIHWQPVPPIFIKDFFFNLKINWPWISDEQKILFPSSFFLLYSNPTVNEYWLAQSLIRSIYTTTTQAIQTLSPIMIVFQQKIKNDNEKIVSL